MEVVLEELDSGGAAIARHKVNHAAFSVGRGHEHAVCLTDVHVCAEHVDFFQEDTKWFVRDLQSVNGARLNGNRLSEQAHVIQSGDVLQVGRSQLRFILPGEPIDKALPISAIDERCQWLARPGVILMSVLLFVSVLASSFYLNGPREGTWTQAFTLTWSVLTTVLWWPVLVAVAAHLLHRPPRFLYHLGFGLLIFNALLWMEGVEVLILANSGSDDALPPIVIAFLLGGVIFALLWMSLQISFRFSSPQRTMIALGMVCLLFVFGAITSGQQVRGFGDKPLYQVHILPPVMIQEADRTVKDVIAANRQLMETLQKNTQKNTLSQKPRNNH
jgi:hypothetical protein